MENKMRIAYVDDELANQKLLGQVLSHEYAFKSYPSAIEFMNDGILHDLVLLDVQMPGINGYRICEDLRAKGYDRPVLFVSAFNSVDDRLIAYEVGGDDYIAKPFDVNELRIKIKNNLNRYAEFQKIKSGFSLASNTALTAMTTISEMGVALFFSQRAHACENLECLAGALKDALRSYGLNAVYCFRNEQQTEYFSTTGAQLSQIEKELLDAYQKLEKIVTHRQRCVLSSGKISIVIKNMPQDEEKTGRLRDHLALIHDISEQAIHFLAAKQQKENLQTIFMDKLQQHTQQIITHIDACAAHSRQRVGDIVENIKQELFGLELKLDLGESNAEILRSISAELQKDLDGITDDFDDIEQQINLLVDAIQNYRPH